MTAATWMSLWVSTPRITSGPASTRSIRVGAGMLVTVVRLRWLGDEGLTPAGRAVRTVTVPVARPLSGHAPPPGVFSGRVAPARQPTDRRSGHLGQSQHGSGRGPGRHTIILTVAAG